MKPFEDWCIVRPKDAEQVTEGGIVLPENARDMDLLREGEVIEIGPGKCVQGGRVLIHANVGERVLYRRKGCIPFERGKIKYAAVRFEDIVCAV